MMSVSVDLKSTPPILGQPIQLFEADYRRDPSVAGVPDYDVAADGKFLVLQDSASAVGMDMSVVVNWGEELKSLAPAKK